MRKHIIVTDCQLLFLYGSLLTGTGLRGLDAKVRHACRPLGTAHIRGRLYDLGRYPGAVASESDKEHVYGTLVRVSNLALWKALDHYEAYDPIRPARSEFIRALTTATLMDTKEQMTCWVYYYNGRVVHRPRIRSGKYKEHLQRIEA